LAQLDVDLNNRLDRIDDIVIGKARTDDLPDGGVFGSASAKCYLIELLTFTVDTENADMAGVMVPAGIDAT